MSVVLPIHVAAGAAAMILGAVALFARKGGTVHRRGGRLFVYAMVVMGLTAAILGNVGGGVMTVYFVVTALLTVRPEAPWTRLAHALAFLTAALLALADIAGGVRALGAPRGNLDGVPFFMFFFLASIFLLAAWGDLRVLRSGPRHGGPRLARHLWRMCFAFFIAAGSFFSVRERVAKILPEPFLSWPMRMMPIVLIFAAMFWWLWKVRPSGPRQHQARARPTEG